MVTVAGINATVTNVFSQVRIKRIQMWFKPPQPDAGVAIPAAGGWQIGFQYLLLPTSTTAVISKQVVALAQGPEDTAYIDVKPSKDYLVGFPMGYNQSVNPFSISCFPGTIIQFDFEAWIADGSTATILTATTGTLGNVGSLYLDINNAAGSRVLGPVGQTFWYN